MIKEKQTDKEKEIEREIEEYKENQKKGIHFRKEINGDGGMSMIWLIDLLQAELKGIQEGKRIALEIIKKLKPTLMMYGNEEAIYQIIKQNLTEKGKETK